MLPQNLRLLKSNSYINGKWVESDSGKTFDVLNPANGEKIAQVADLGAAETRRAINAAAHAMPAWAARTAKDRATTLRKWLELIMQHQEDLALLLTSEQGKSLTEARGEVAYGASFIEWFAEEAKRVYGDVIPETVVGQKIVVTKQAIGVVAAITPWNFPLAMITRKVAPALAAGCTVVVKPSDETPLCALALAVLAEAAGIPPGVFNIVNSTHAAEVGEELCKNPLVRKLSFTGSTGVGKILMRQCADTVKKVSLELGGNAPFIVFEDADIALAVKGAVASKYRNSGQTCVCTNRFLIHSRVYDEFAVKLVAAVKHLVVGDGTDSGVQQGPLINSKAVKKVESHIADAKAKGAKILVGGQSHSRGGLFFEPTVLSEVTAEMQLTQEETFGPVAGLIRFETENEAIELANATPFGLAAYFYTTDLARAWRVAAALECGMVGINEGLISSEVAPFGGIKESGMGREGSKYGILDYVETKYVLFGGLV